MKNSPLIGVLVGVIIVLLIVVFSLGYQVSKWNKEYTQEKKQKLELSQTADMLQEKTDALQAQLEETTADLVSKTDHIAELELQLNKLDKLKGKLEENLSEELIKDNSPVQQSE